MADRDVLMISDIIHRFPQMRDEMIQVEERPCGKCGAGYNWQSVSFEPGIKIWSCRKCGNMRFMAVPAKMRPRQDLKELTITVTRNGKGALSEKQIKPCKNCGDDFESYKGTFCERCNTPRKRMARRE